MIQPTTFEYVENDGVATITLNRPDRLNALTFEVYAELRDLFAGLAEEKSIRVIIITGAGRGFCSGGDVEAIIGDLLKREMRELLAFTDDGRPDSLHPRCARACDRRPQRRSRWRRRRDCPCR